MAEMIWQCHHKCLHYLAFGSEGNISRILRINITLGMDVNCLHCKYKSLDSPGLETVKQL